MVTCFSPSFNNRAHIVFKILNRINGAEVPRHKGGVKCQQLQYVRTV